MLEWEAPGRRNLSKHGDKIRFRILWKTEGTTGNIAVLRLVKRKKGQKVEWGMHGAKSVPVLVSVSPST